MNSLNSHRTRSTSRRAAAGFKLALAMTPMIDMVFLLLVFFVCTIRFERSEEVFRLDLPARAETADPLALRDAPVLVIIGVRDGARCEIEIRAEGMHTSAENFEALAAVMEKYRRKTGTNDGLFEPSHPILIVPARGSTWQDAVDGFNAAVRAGYANIGFAESKS